MPASRILGKCASKFLVYVAWHDGFRCRRFDLRLRQKIIQDADIFEAAVQTLAVKWDHGMRGVSQENGPVQVVIRV